MSILQRVVHKTHKSSPVNDAYHQGWAVTGGVCQVLNSSFSLKFQLILVSNQRNTLKKHKTNLKLLTLNYVNINYTIEVVEMYSFMGRLG